MFLAGEFSKIARVSKRLLHYYDDIGLLPPAHIDEATGYRYYSAKQLPRLNRILALKELGLTLDQITRLLHDEIADDEIRGMLMLKKAEMEQVVDEGVQRLRGIEARLQQNQLADDAPDVVIKSIPMQPFLAIRTVIATEAEALQLVDQVLRTVSATVRPNMLGPFACVAYAEDFTLTNSDVEFGYLLKRQCAKPIPLTDGRVLEMHELPPVETMATAVQIGGPDPALIALGKVAQWIEANGYRIAGPYREIVFDVTNLSDLDEAVYEIQMPVKKLSATQPSATQPEDDHVS